MSPLDKASLLVYGKCYFWNMCECCGKEFAACYNAQMCDECKEMMKDDSD